MLARCLAAARPRSSARERCRRGGCCIRLQMCHRVPLVKPPCLGLQVVPGAAADVSKQPRNAARTDAFITLRTADGALSLEVEVLGVPPEDTVAPSEVEVRDAWLAAFRFLLSSHPFPPGDDLIRTPAVSERMSTDNLLAALTPDGLAAGSGGATGAAGAGAGAGSRGGVFNDESV